MKKMMITGGGGWLARKLIHYFKNDYEITLLLRDEEKKQKIEGIWKDVKFIFHDLQFPIEKDYGSFDVIIHAAAMKHITTELFNPDLVWSCNTGGTVNLLDYWYDYSENARAIYIGTDKSCNPCTEYGKSKARSEEIFKEECNNYSIVRFGNLAGSSGSLFQILIKKFIWGDNNFEISDPESERYFLTWRQAADLIKEAIKGKEELYVGNYKKIKIVDLIKTVFPNANIRFVGLRPGEKIREELDKNENNEYYSTEEIRELWKTVLKEEISDALS